MCASLCHCWPLCGFANIGFVVSFVVTAPLHTSLYLHRWQGQSMVHNSGSETEDLSWCPLDYDVTSRRCCFGHVAITSLLLSSAALVTSLLRKLNIPLLWKSNVTRFVWPFVIGHIEPDEMCHVSDLLAIHWSNVIILEEGWKGQAITCNILNLIEFFSFLNSFLLVI